MNGLTPSLAMMRPLARPTAAPAAIPASTPAAMPNFTIVIAAMQPAKRHRRADRKIEAAADDDEGHADGDHRHDRGLHQDVGEVERRQEAAGQERGDDAKHHQRDQRDLPDDVEARCPSSAADGRVQLLLVEALPRALEARS